MHIFKLQIGEYVDSIKNDDRVSLTSVGAIDNLAFDCECVVDDVEKCHKQATIAVISTSILDSGMTRHEDRFVICKGHYGYIKERKHITEYEETRDVFYHTLNKHEYNEHKK